MIMYAAGPLMAVIGLMILLSALFALPVMWLYNYVIPHQFGSYMEQENLRANWERVVYIDHMNVD